MLQKAAVASDMEQVPKPRGRKKFGAREGQEEIRPGGPGSSGEPRGEDGQMAPEGLSLGCFRVPRLSGLLPGPSLGSLKLLQTSLREALIHGAEPKAGLLS